MDINEDLTNLKLYRERQRYVDAAITSLEHVAEYEARSGELANRIAEQETALATLTSQQNIELARGTAEVDRATVAYNKLRSEYAARRDEQDTDYAQRQSDIDATLRTAQENADAVLKVLADRVSSATYELDALTAQVERAKTAKEAYVKDISSL